MNDFSENVKALNTYPTEFARKLAEDEDLAEVLQNPDETLAQIKQTLAGVRDKFPESRAKKIEDRIDCFESMIGALKRTVNPNNSENEKKNAASNFCNFFNSVMGAPYDSFTNTSFGDDIAELLNTVGHEMQDDPIVTMLYKISNVCSDIQDMSDDLEKKELLSNINAKFKKTTESSDTFKQERDNTISTMYQINPNLTVPELEGLTLRANNAFIKADAEYATYTSEQCKKDRQIVREATKKAYEDTELELHKEEKFVKEAEEKAEFIKTGSGYSLDRLESESKKMRELDNANLMEEKAINRMKQELDEAQNSEKLLKAAQKKVADAQAGLDKVLADTDKDGDYKAWFSIGKYAAAGFTVTELLPELITAQEKGKFYPALLDMGIINGIPGSNIKRAPIENPNKDSAPIEFLEKKDIAEKYVRMRNAIIDATRPINADPTKETETEKFFKALETSRDQYAPMQIIKDKFADDCIAIRDDAISTQLITVKRNPEIFTDEVIAAEKDKLTQAEEELYTLKTRIGATRKADIIKKDIKRAENRIKENNAEKLEISNNFLMHFGEEPRNEAVAPEELGVIGEKKYAELMSEVIPLSSGEHKFENIRKLSDYRNKMEQSSLEAEIEETNSLKDKRDKATKQRDVANRLKNSFDGLFRRQREIADKQDKLKYETAKACQHVPFENTANALFVIGSHIEDATRFISHTNSDQFKAMTGRLFETVNALKDESLTNEQKLDKLGRLKTDTETYIAAKREQSRGIFASTMRKSRLNYANQILELTNKAINRGTALTTSTEWKTAQKNLISEQFDKNMSEAQFRRDFSERQEEYRMQKRAEALQQKNQSLNAPVIQNNNL